MHRPVLILLILFSFVTATFAQAAPVPQSNETVYEQSQNTHAQSTPTYTSASPVIQYADDRLAVIAWRSSANTEGRVYYGTDPNDLNLVAEDNANSTSHRVHLSNLAASTTYYFQIETENGQPEVFTFRTPAAGATPLREARASIATNVRAQNNGIVITNGPTIQFADDRSAVITWTTAVAAPSALYYGTVQSNLNQSAFGEPNTTSHRVYLNNLVPHSTYYIQVDTGSPSSPIRTFQTVAGGAAPIYNQVAAQIPRSAVAATHVNPPATSTSTGANGNTATNAATANSTSTTGEPQLGRREEMPVYPGGVIVPAGTEIQAKIEQALSSKTSRQGDQFTALVLQPINGTNGRVAIPAGTRIRGEVSGVEQGKVLSSVRGKARLNLKFNDVAMPNGSYVPLEATLVSVGKTGASANEEGQVQDKTQGKEVAKDVGIGAGLGTVAGLIFGSALKGLAIGAIAGGGYVLATQGRDVNIPEDSNIVLRTDRAISLPPGAASPNSATTTDSSGVNPR
jgi:Purple acid Phosphatase, N-terminal domain